MISYNKVRGFNTAIAVTPHDTNLVGERYNQGFMVTGAGNISLDVLGPNVNGAQTYVTLPTFAVALNTVYKDIQFARIRASGTTATGIFGLGYT